MSLGGKSTEKTEIDPELRKFALDNLNMARRVGQLGYIPYTGDTVAGMQPGQIAAIQSGNMGGEAFGLPTMAVPTGANLNPYATYTDALANIPAGQRAFIESMFINPQTGAAPTMNFGQAAAPASNTQQSSGNRRRRDYEPTGRTRYTAPRSGSGGGAADSGQAGNRRNIMDFITGLFK